ncbi:MFS transporter [Niallia sp. FSL R7-0271]|uniref:MFS transporter n=1 Tax=Niallia sp. FSL R7-0271 TaxID=2921678 RepID=UPI0030F66DA5
MNKKVFLYVKAFSDLGTFMDLIAINVLMYAATGSTGWLAATMAFRTLGGVLSSLFSGVLADRFDRRKIMITADVLRAAIILLLLIYPNPVMIVTVCFLIGLTTSLFAVSYSAEIPQIFGEDKVINTNALIARLTSVSLVFGFIGAGIITELIGYQATLIIDGATYILSAFILMRMKWQTSAQTKTPLAASSMKSVLTSLGNDLREVNAFILLAPMLLLVNLVFLIGSFAGASHNLGIPLLAEVINGEKQSLYYGLIWGAWGIGSVFATMIMPKIKFQTERSIYYACFVSAMLMSAGFIIFFSNTNSWIILIFAFVTGIFDATFTTLHAVLLQKTDNHIRGRIFGVGMLLKSLGFALGFVIAPLILEATSLKQMVWIFHGSLIASTVCIIFIALNTSKKRKLWKSVS